MRVLQVGRATTGEIVNDLDLAPECPRLAENSPRYDHAILGGLHFRRFGFPVAALLQGLGLAHLYAIFPILLKILSTSCNLIARALPISSGHRLARWMRFSMPEKSGLWETMILSRPSA